MSTDPINQTPPVSLETDHPEFKVYKPPLSTPLSSQPQNFPPDSFYEPTVEDIRSSQATLSNRSKDLNNAPLLPRTARNAIKEAKRSKWPNTTIRIKFSDSTQVEKSFASEVQITSVYEFCSSLLRDDVKRVKFILYQPPRQEFKKEDTSSLEQLQLAPSSVLSLRFEDPSLNRSNIPAPLSSSVVARAIDLPRPPILEEHVANPSSKSGKKDTVSSPSKLDKMAKLLKIKKQHRK